MNNQKRGAGRHRGERCLGKVLSLKNLLIVVVALLLAFPPLILQPSPVFATSATYTTTADSYIYENEPTANYGGATALQVASYKTGANLRNKHTLVKFDLSSIPAGATIESATLQLYMTAPPDSTDRTYDAHRVTADWTEGTGTAASPGTSDVTWDNRTTGTAWTTAGGDFNLTPTASTATGTTPNVWLSWDITADVAAWYEATASNYGILVKDATEDSKTIYEASFASRESGSNVPELVVTYVKASTTVSPSSVYDFESVEFTTTITNSGGTSGDEIHSASFTIPTGYSNIPTTAGGYTVTAAGGTKNWTVTGLPSGSDGPQTVTVTASTAPDDIANTESVQIVFTCTTPFTTGETPWTSSATGAAGGTNNPASQTVTVNASGLILTISGEGNVQWNPVVPTTPSYSGTVTANVQAGVAWQIMVEKDQDLQTATLETIASADFKYTSSGAPLDNVTTPTEFNTTMAIIGSGSEVTPGLDVLVDYVLTTHYSQKAGSYTATHTYTLLAQ